MSEATIQWSEVSREHLGHRAKVQVFRPHRRESSIVYSGLIVEQSGLLFLDDSFALHSFDPTQQVEIL